jgi:hypothetical protein
MISRKKIKTSRYLAALALTVVVFLIGYIIGSEINDMKLQNLQRLEQDIRVESLGNELVFQLVQKDLCGSINMTSYTEELADIGKRLTYMESIYGYNAPEVVQLKNYYSLLQVRHWILTGEVNQKCGYDQPTILYFYTNDGCVDCEDQGLVLTNVYRNYPLFNTYSFEYNLENPALDFIKQRYDIKPERLPTLVINGEVHYGFQSKDFLVEKLALEDRLARAQQEHPEWFE